MSSSVDDLMAAMKDASAPRDIALSGLALVEHVLDALLAKRGVQAGGSFADRVARGRARGLFDDDVRANLDLIHQIGEIARRDGFDSFDVSSVAAHMQQVRVTESFNEGDRAKLDGVRNGVGGSRKAFIGLCQIMAGALTERGQQ